MPLQFIINDELGQTSSPFSIPKPENNKIHQHLE
jgi:hypothetical protein